FVGPYRISSALGRGGMGVVYRGRHATTGEVVAVKTVRVPSASMLSCIRREIHALSRLHHPAVARIVGEGIHEGLPYYAMQLYEGETLRGHLDRLWDRHAPERSLVREVGGASPSHTLTATFAESTSGEGDESAPPSARLRLGMDELAPVLGLIRG